MKSTTTIALICFVLLPSISTDASQGLQLRNPQELQGPCLATLIHQFRQHRIASPTDNRILFASEKHSFNGSANDLNRILRQIADLPRSESLSVFSPVPRAISPVSRLRLMRHNLLMTTTGVFTFFRGISRFPFRSRPVSLSP